MKEWNKAFPDDRQPDDNQIADFIRTPLWSSINDYLCRAYMTGPKYSYSGCSMQQGWNVKYSNSGKSLCTLYPMDGYFTMLVVIGPKEMTEAELMMPFLSEPVRSVFAKTKNGRGAKWLMLDICDWETLLDALKLIALRRKPINLIEMEDEDGKNI